MLLHPYKYHTDNIIDIMYCRYYHGYISESAQFWFLVIMKQIISYTVREMASQLLQCVERSKSSTSILPKSFSELVDIGSDDDDVFEADALD